MTHVPIWQVGRGSRATAIGYAAQFDAHECVRELLAGGADPNLRRGDGLPPLQHAVHNRALRCVRELIDGGADLTARAKDGETLLSMACRKNLPEVVEQLLDKPEVVALIDESDDSGATPLSWACQDGNVRVAAALLGAGADRDKPNCKNGTPLMLAMHGAGEGHLRCARELLAARADANWKDRDSDGCLALSLLRGNLAGAELLIALLYIDTLS